MTTLGGFGKGSLSDYGTVSIYLMGGCYTKSQNPSLWVGILIPVRKTARDFTKGLRMEHLLHRPLGKILDEAGK
jgi:hypothetical protein